MFFTKFLLTFLAPAAVLGAPIAPVLKVVGDVIADNFIVVLNPQPQAGFQNFLKSRDASIIAATKDTFSIGNFQGFTGTFKGPVLDLVKGLAQVKYIEQVTKVQALGLNTQSNAP
jgi:hypothetical protein